MIQNKIKEFREKQKPKMTQEQLAEQIGIARTYLSEIENNKYEPSVGMALRIARVLNTMVEYIFFEVDVK